MEMFLHRRFKVLELGVGHSLVVREVKVGRVRAQNRDVGVRLGSYDQAFQLLRTSAGRTKRHKKRYSEHKKATRHREKYAGFVPKFRPARSIKQQSSILREPPVKSFESQTSNFIEISNSNCGNRKWWAIFVT